MERSVSIPEKIISGLELLLHLDEQQRKSLFDQLSTVNAFVNSRAYSNQIDHEAMGTTEADKWAIIDALFSLFLGKYTLNMLTDDFVEGISRTLFSRPELKEKFLPDKEDYYKTVLSLFLSLEHTVGFAAKSLVLLMNYDHLFTEARICTDFRPVFGENASSLPQTGFIVHNLAITYREEDSDKTFFVALDDSDLQSLAEVINRAVSKSNALAETLSVDSKFSLITFGE